MTEIAFLVELTV